MARRRLGPLIFTVVMVLLLLGLGTWQVERLQWKEGLIAARDAALVAAPVPPPATFAEAQALDLHRVEAAGTFLNDKEVAVAAIASDGDYGFSIVTPLRLSDGSLLLVNRGWVPADRKTPSARSPIDGETRVVGLLRVRSAGKPGYFTPDNRPDQNQWYYIDPQGMAAAGHLDGVRPYWIDADATPNPGGYPIGGQTMLDLPNNHLQYAITWYSLALALVVIFAIYERRLRKSP